MRLMHERRIALRYDYARWQLAIERANACIIPAYDEMRAEARKLSPYKRDEMFREWSIRRHDMAEVFYRNPNALRAF